jgi:hypothetical protein
MDAPLDTCAETVASCRIARGCAVSASSSPLDTSLLRALNGWCRQTEGAVMRAGARLSVGRLGLPLWRQPALRRGLAPELIDSC